MAGAFLRRRTARTFQEYADLLERRGAGAPEGAEPRFEHRSATGHKASLADALRVTGPLLDEHPGLDRALDVLAWSASASMSWPLLESLVEPDDADQLRDGVDIAEALRVLRREGEVRGGVPRFRMHRLVQEVRRNERPVATSPELARAVLIRIGDWFEARREDFSDLEAFEAELDHLEAWAGAADVLDVPAARVRLRWLRAYPYWHRGQYEKSRVEIDGALRVYRDGELADPATEANLWADRAAILAAEGRYREALANGERALSLRRATLGERHRDTAMSYNNVGGIFGYLGDHRRALEFKTTGLRLHIGVLGEKHPRTATSYNSIGATLDDLGDHRRALELNTLALKLRIDTRGERHPETADSYNSVGSTYWELGDHAEALRLKSIGLDIRRAVLGERHPDTAQSYANVGISYHELGDRSNALEYQGHAHKLLQELLGERHPITATVCRNLGVSYGTWGDPRKALDFVNRAFDVRRELLGNRHPDTIQSGIDMLLAL